ncbi:MAG: hypothetical protein JNM93_10575 [Bacteriovoracaceae bacterium]|nr:hypothetical protein [Bacteriovoracaceae bacterium]
MKNEKGQSLFEFVFFLPVFIICFLVLTGLGSAINGSINQQKITRGYFFIRNKNNSNLPRPVNASATTWTKFGMFYVGYKINQFSGTSDQPEAACYKINLPFASTFSDTDCSNPYSTLTTDFVRVYTVFGLCGATYERNGQDVRPSSNSWNREACLLID